jgi:hypothetical protein
MPVHHGRVEHLFTVSSGIENASCGWSTATVESLTDGELQDTIDSIEAHFLADVWSGFIVSQYYTNAVSYLGARLSDIDGTGHVVRSRESIESASIPGIAGGKQLPPECAVVVSLKTSHAGPSGRGRMYLPCISTDFTTATGGIASGCRDGIAVAMGNFFTDVKADATHPLDPIVFSKVHDVGYDIAEVRVGNVVDSQRGRRKSIVESYHSVSVPS